MKCKYNELLRKVYEFCNFAITIISMADTMTDAQRHHIMSQVHSASTRPELKLRHALWHLKFRFRVNDKHLPGKPDIVLPKYRTAIFVHGCFWHGHNDCKYASIPKTNTEFWTEKITRNQQRDQDVWRQLEAKGWSVIVVWECELKKDQFQDTIDKVSLTIRNNGKILQQIRDARKEARLQYQAERRQQRQREQLLTIELRQKFLH